MPKSPRRRPWRWARSAAKPAIKTLRQSLAGGARGGSFGRGRGLHLLRPRGCWPMARQRCGGDLRRSPPGGRAQARESSKRPAARFSPASRKAFRCWSSNFARTTEDVSDRPDDSPRTSRQSRGGRRDGRDGQSDARAWRVAVERAGRPERCHGFARHGAARHERCRSRCESRRSAC